MKNISTSLRMSALACACVSACAVPTLAQAQSTPQLTEVVITPSRFEQRAQDALPATTLITRADIERAQTPDLPSLLRQVTGVEISQSGGQGTLASAFMRGGASRHTLVLIDGVPVNNLSFGTAALEHLPLANVERIEVVRGNVSALYGSAALGGVIQIFTKEATGKPQLTVTGQLGQRGLRQLDASGGVKLDSGTRLSASVQTLQDDGFNAIDNTRRSGTNPDVDGYKRRALSLGVSQDIGPASIGLRVRRASGTTQYDSEFGPATQADESQFVESGTTLDVALKASNSLTLKAALTDSASKLNADVSAFPYFVNSRSKGVTLGADWAITRGQRLSAGYERNTQSIASDTVYNQDSRTQSSLRLGYQADIGQHQLQLNVRNDKYSDFGSANTYLAGYAYNFTDALRANASVSTGFNAPTFNDLFYPFGGNPLLKPERLKSSELGLQYAQAGHTVRAVVFSNRYTDLIGYDTTFTSVNIDKASNKGVEVSYQGRMGTTDVRAGITSQNPVDDTTGQRLLRRAQTVANVGASHSLGAYKLGADLRYSGARPDRDDLGAIAPLDSYSVLDLKASYAINKQVTVFGRIDNALNQRYETVYGYKQAERGVFAGLSWAMQ
jgi:vitamin B12 transporter